MLTTLRKRSNIITETENKPNERGDNMTDNKLLSSRTQRYEIKASNGQTLEHGFTSQKKALARLKEYKATYPDEKFYISGYDRGKYGNE